ncbi:MAG: MerR family transcriptional regulator [Raoultibacter sp.]
MRSGKFAQLAGVTPRTLRHYRSLGLIAEPARQENGYCEYGIPDLVRILRIKRLASLGFSLETIHDMLSQPNQTRSESTFAQLDELDRELAARIEELHHQRETIARLKEEAFDADLPIDFADIARLLRESGMSEELLEEEYEGMILVDHLFNESERSLVATFYRSLAEEDNLQAYAELAARIYTLSDDSTEEECTAIVEACVDLVVPLCKQINPHDYPTTSPESLLLDQYETTRLNETQRPVYARIVNSVYDILGWEREEDGDIKVFSDPRLT